MTSRERVLSAIAHREPDRVPLDIGSTPSSGISAIAYNSLKKHLGLTEGHTRIYDVVQQVAEPEETILDRFGADVIDIGRAFNEKDSDWYDVTPRCTTTAAEGSRSFRRMADSCSIRSTTFSRTCRRRTFSPCTGPWQIPGRAEPTAAIRPWAHRRPV